MPHVQHHLLSSLNQSIHWFVALSLALTWLGSFSIDDGNCNDNAQIKNLIGRVRKNKRAARAARTYESVLSSAKQQLQITTFTVLMTTWAYNRKSLILCI